MLPPEELAGFGLGTECAWNPWDSTADPSAVTNPVQARARNAAWPKPAQLKHPRDTIPAASGDSVFNCTFILFHYLSNLIKYKKSGLASSTNPPLISGLQTTFPAASGESSATPETCEGRRLTNCTGFPAAPRYAASLGTGWHFHVPRTAEAQAHPPFPPSSCLAFKPFEPSRQASR